MLLLLIVSLVSPIWGQGFHFGGRSPANPQTRLGLLAPSLGLNPVPPLPQQSHQGTGSQALRENPVCGYNQRCCCVEAYECTVAQGNDGSGVIDIRIVNNPTSGSQQQSCQYPLVQCCSEQKPQPKPQPIYNPYCQQGQKCCCVRRGTCYPPNDGSGVIDIRLVAKRNRQCRRNQELCCVEENLPSPQPPYVPTPDPYVPTPDPYVPNPGQYVQNPGPPLNGNNCGYSQSYPNSAYHGQYGQADFGEYNWLVVILDLNNLFVGAGALLDSTTVLTADHKVFNHTARYLKVRAREWDAQEDSEPLKHIEVKVSRIISHPSSNVRYTKLTNLKNDVAIIKLAQPIRLNNEYVGSVCLPQQGVNFDGQTCWVAGWGKNAFGHEGQYQRILKEVDLEVVSAHQCERLLRGVPRLGQGFQFDGHSFMCAGGKHGKDACEGDGGAPLVCNYQGRWYVAGLVAWGIGCATQNVPGVYVNVPSFSNWIIENAGYGNRRG